MLIVHKKETALSSDQLTLPPWLVGPIALLAREHSHLAGRHRDRVNEASTDGDTHPTRRRGRRLISAVLAGTLLNPLNSSMIAVALILIQSNFRVSAATVSLLLSSFSLAAAIAQPLMGRFSDLFGPRRVFCAGLLLVGVTSALAPLAPAFGWLIVLRMLQALGTSAAYPAGLAIIRAVD